MIIILRDVQMFYQEKTCVSTATEDVQFYGRLLYYKETHTRPHIIKGRLMQNTTCLACSNVFRIIWTGRPAIMLSVRKL